MFLATPARAEISCSKDGDSEICTPDPNAADTYTATDIDGKVIKDGNGNPQLAMNQLKSQTNTLDLYYTCVMKLYDKRTDGKCSDPGSETDTDCTGVSGALANMKVCKKKSGLPPPNDCLEYGAGSPGQTVGFWADIANKYGQTLNTNCAGDPSNANTAGIDAGVSSFAEQIQKNVSNMGRNQDIILNTNGLIAANNGLGRSGISGTISTTSTTEDERSGKRRFTHEGYDEGSAALGLAQGELFDRLVNDKEPLSDIIEGSPYGKSLPPKVLAEIKDSVGTNTSEPKPELASASGLSRGGSSQAGSSIEGSGATNPGKQKSSGSAVYLIGQNKEEHGKEGQESKGSGTYEIAAQNPSGSAAMRSREIASLPSRDKSIFDMVSSQYRKKMKAFASRKSAASAGLSSSEKPAIFRDL